ncbi:MAG: hypothetical protein KBD64_07670, partial [Gammaproteobacteria bacterium]|nr:hypothetical protein [Gammaproteobacteria bacterium]
MLGRKTRTLRDAYPEGDPYLAPVTYPYTSTFPSVPIPLPPMQARGGPTQAGLDAVARGIGGVEIGGDTEAPQEQPQTGNRAITSQRPDQSYPRKIIYEISNFGLLTSLVLATIGDLTTKLNNCLVQTTMLFLSGFFFMVSPKFGKTKGLPYFSSPMPIVGIIYITFSLLAFFLNAIPLAWDYDTNFDSVSDKSKATTKCINDTVVFSDGLNHSR